MTEFIRDEFLKEFDERHKDYIPDYTNECSYRFTSSSGYAIEIFIYLKTFVFHVSGRPVYFIGNVRGDRIYLYDHNRSVHCRYRVTRYAEGRIENTIETAIEKN